jgi:hypothetical protein
MNTHTSTIPATTVRTRATTSLLVAGAVGGPLWAVASLTQAATRTGFDITRPPVSVLSNGDLGWVQIANFLIAGLLALAGAAGSRLTLNGGPGGTWAPILHAVQGAGLIVAGGFRLDPLDGFPPGTPPGTPTSMSGVAVVHNLGGSLAFVAMIAVCFVLARWFTTTHRGWAISGRCAGGLFAAGLVWAFSGRPAGALTLLLGVVIAWTWITISLAYLARTRGKGPS